MGATRFRYRAVDRDGKPQTGELEATSSAQALQTLQARSLTPVELEAPAAAGPAPAARAARLDDEQRSQLLHELATLLGAGVPLGEALPSLELAYAGTGLGLPLQRLRREVQAGRNLAESAAGADFGWPAYALPLIAAGEATGDLANALRTAADQLDQERALRRQVRAALTYPAVLVGAGVVAVAIIFVAVVPRFASLLGSGRAELPALSRWVIQAGLFTREHWLGAALALAALLALAAWALRTPALRASLWNTLAGWPVVGPWIVATETGRWAGLLGRLLEQRVPMLDALALAQRASGLQALRSDLDAARQEVRRGQPLSRALAGSRWLPPTRLNLLAVGERSGELPAMLVRLGQLQAEQASQRMQRLLALIEPAAIVVIGSVIGVIMAGVVLAITSVNTARF